MTLAPLFFHCLVYCMRYILQYGRELVKLTSLLSLCSWIFRVQSRDIMLGFFLFLSYTLFSAVHVSLGVRWAALSLSIAQGMVCIVTTGELFCLPGPLLLHADSTTSVPIANTIFLLEARKEHVVRWLQVSEQVFVDGCPFDNCYLWCAAVRKLNLISQAESFPALNSNWGSYFTLAFPFHPVPTIWCIWYIN